MPISREAILHWTDFTIGLLIPPYGIYRVERQLRQIGRSREQANLVGNQDGEPVLPNNPETATPEQIEAYKKAVREAGNTSPQRK